MPDKKPTDSEIVKALECVPSDVVCNVGEDYITVADILDLINRKDTEIERLQAENKKNENIIRLADKTIATANAEIERLKSAYKQRAWERDVFAEDMIQEIKKDCSYLMLDIKTIKSEAYKEYHKRFEKNIKDVKVTLGQTWEIQNALKKTYKELVGEDNESKN